MTLCDREHTQIVYDESTLMYQTGQCPFCLALKLSDAKDRALIDYKQRIAALEGQRADLLAQLSMA